MSIYDECIYIIFRLVSPPSPHCGPIKKPTQEQAKHWGWGTLTETPEKFTPWKMTAVQESLGEHHLAPEAYNLECDHMDSSVGSLLLSVPYPILLLGTASLLSLPSIVY